MSSNKPVDQLFLNGMPFVSFCHFAHAVCLFIESCETYYDIPGRIDGTLASRSLYQSVGSFQF